MKTTSLKECYELLRVVPLIIDVNAYASNSYEL